jgi:chromosome segregation ATPase
MKSPISANKEEGIEDEYLPENLMRSSKNRPISAKIDSANKQKRPITAKHPPINIKSGKQNQLAFAIINKLKPNKVNIDKEQLYEDNMALKVKINGLQEELVRLKTKLSQMEKELNKKEEQNEQLVPSKSNFLISKLKNTIKDLKFEMVHKNEEIGRIKQTVKSTKLSEIEIEIQAYIDECTRLRHHLEEVMRQRDMQIAQFSPMQATELNEQEKFLINNLKKENENLNQALLLGKDEITKWRERVIELEKDKKKQGSKRGEINVFRGEIKGLKTKIEQMSKEFGVKENGLKDEISKQKKVINEFTIESQRKKSTLQSYLKS